MEVAFQTARGAILHSSVKIRLGKQSHVSWQINESCSVADDGGASAIRLVFP